ncbi:MAG: GNAT family protein [Candidatus Bathyarchaeia archaeon]|jgi:RimJ/RimL family protein N-acetyltransferase
MEKEDLDFFVECHNDVAYYGEDGPIVTQMSRVEAEKRFENPPPLAMLTERGRFVIEKKDATRIGFIAHYFVLPSRFMEIGYDIIPNERRKGYGTEAVEIMVDYLFLSKDTARIQAVTNVGNKASQRVREKAGFKKEGTLRKVGHVRGEPTDAYIYSILREEWKEPMMLTKTEKKKRT